MKQRKDSGPTEPIIDEATNEEHVSTPSYDSSQSGEDRMQLNELMDLCAKLSDRVLALENTNTSQAAEIATLKKRVKKLEKKRRSRTYKPRRLYKVSLSRRIESFDDVSLGAQEDASKQGRKIIDLDADTEILIYSKSKEKHEVHLKVVLELLKKEELFAKLSNDYDCEIRYHLGKANIVVRALSRNERVKLGRLRAMAMTIQSRVKRMILAAQSEAFMEENKPAERLHGLDQQI
ncbi:hypothetical protein Tco_0282575 [Tanacetum coccineum]